MSFWGTLFGSETIVQAGIDGIDKIVYTDEEKADNKLLFLKAYEPFKLAQRFLMMIVGIPYMTCWLATFIVSFYSVDVTFQTAMLEGNVGSVFWTIAAFYFGGGLLEGGIKAYKK
jgi:hypothetical protein